jgi:signal transduction histidine kinase
VIDAGLEPESALAPPGRGDAAIHGRSFVSHSPLIVLFDPEARCTEEHAAALRADGFRTSRIGDPGAIRAALRESQELPAALVVVVNGRGMSEHADVIPEARSRGIPVIGLVAGADDADSLAEKIRDLDDWVPQSSTPVELSTRLGRALAGRNAEASRSRETMEIPIDVRMLEVIVHDIRNPLNVIGLTLRVIEQIPPERRADIQEDLTFLRDNAGQIERMLTLISEFCRLKREENPSEPSTFDPRRLLEQVVEDRAFRSPERGLPLHLEIDPSTPTRVDLDPSRVRYAVIFAIFNALGAADRPVTVKTSGRNGRWTVAIVVEKPPPSSVVPFEVVSDTYERLIGSVGERKGLDLVIAGWVVQSFGGKVRLNVEPGKRTTILIDLPVSHSSI